MDDKANQAKEDQADPQPRTGEAAADHEDDVVYDPVSWNLVVQEKVEDEKSDVELDPDAPDASRRFGKGDRIHMTVRDPTDGVKRKAIFTVKAARIDKTGSYWEYKLVDLSGYTDGRYYREKYLKLESRAR